MPQVNRQNDPVRDAILKAARAEFAASGRRGASVRAIAKRAGVTAAMINYYFGGKQALYDVVVDEAQARLFRRMAAVMAGVDERTLAAELAGAYFDFLAEERELQQLLLREVLDDGAAVRQLAHRYVAPLRDLFERHFGSDDETYHTAISLFGAVAGYFLYAPTLGAVRDQDPLTPERLAQRREHVMRVASKLQELTP